MRRDNVKKKKTVIIIISILIVIIFSLVILFSKMYSNIQSAYSSIEPVKLSEIPGATVSSKSIMAATDDALKGK